MPYTHTNLYNYTGSITANITANIMLLHTIITHSYNTKLYNQVLSYLYEDHWSGSEAHNAIIEGDILQHWRVNICFESMLFNAKGYSNF